MKAIFLKSAVVLFALTTIALSVNSQSENYKKLWDEIQKLETKGLPKSALEKVEQIYNLALKENNEQQIVKSLVYKIKYNNQLEENGLVYSIKKTEENVKTLNYVSNIAKPFLHLTLSVLYKQYYEQNQWKINGRSVTANYDSDDLETWDKTKFQDKIIKNAIEALDGDLMHKKTEDFPDIIENAKYGNGCLPTLYDAVADYIVTQIFKENNYRYYYGLTDTDKLDDKHLLDAAKNFVIKKITVDTLSYNQNAVVVYQNWLKLRMENQNQLEALIFADLKRIEFVKNALSHQQKNELYVGSLKMLKDKYENFPEVVRVNNSLAQHYINLGNTYNFETNPNQEAMEANCEAMKILENSLEKFPNAKYSDVSLSLKTQLQNPFINFKVENIVSPDKKFPIRIEYKNTNSLFLTVVEYSYFDYKYIYNYDINKKLVAFKNAKRVFSLEINLREIKDYNSHYTKYLVNQLKTGSYVIILHTNKDLQDGEFMLAEQFVQVADIMLFTKSKNHSEKEFYVYNSITGKALENANINLYKQEWKNSGINFKKIFNTKTDKNGQVNPYVSNNYDNSNQVFEVTAQNQKIYVEEGIWRSYYYDKLERQNIVKIFTDRAIYRPGQSVNFKAIAYSTLDGNLEILTNYKINIEFNDVNYQTIESLELQTNEFGSVSGIFEIPLNVLTGNFTLRANNYEGSNYVKVEEYKRPNFEIETLPVKDEFKFNDDVSVEGTAKNYAGTAVTGAKVSYRVTRNPQYFRYWYWIPREEPTEVAFGETETDDNGIFKVNFKAIVDEHNVTNKNLYYNFNVEITVTDINGETQIISSNVIVSNVSLKLSAEIQEKVSKENFKEIKINSTNISNEFIASNVEIKIIKLFTPATALKSDVLGKIDINNYNQSEWYNSYPGNVYGQEDNLENFSAQKIVYQQKINTKNTKSIIPNDLKNWENGAYRIEVKGKDKFNNEVSDIQEFVLFSEKSAKMPYPATDFYYCDKKTAQPGETVTLKIGSSYKDVEVQLNIIRKGKEITTIHKKLNSEIIDLPIKITEEDRGGLLLNVMFLREGRVYTYSENVTVEFENKKLHFKTLTIRDLTVQPGQTIAGQVLICDKDSVPVDAEMLATLYDASLDVFAKNTWSFWMYPYFYENIDWNGHYRVLNTYYAYTNNYFQNVRIENNLQPQFNLLNRIFDYYGNMRNRGIAYLKKADSMEVLEESVSIDYDVDDQTIALDERSEISFKDKNPKKESGGSEQSEKEEINATDNFKARSNFAETAFFYPNLRTNKDGNIEFTFTMPDALTRWNFMGLAHTKDLKIGQVSTNITTQKDLMVMPNLPRFFRENDKITISAKINNISDSDITGIAKLELYNSETLENLNAKFGVSATFNNQNFLVKINGNSAVSWNLQIPEGISAVGIKITAESDSHIDGEERILPILTNKMLVTEAIPLPVRKAGITNFEFKSLKNNNSTTLRNEKFTLEYTANPAWYALMALPYLMEYPYECNEQTFSRYYANALATHIANSNPKIKRIFELWKTTPNSQALLSNLEKNHELKALMIEETPWLLDGKNEAERKQKLGILFDLNRMTHEVDGAIKKLQQNQNSDGGWSWFKGNEQSSNYITQHIVAGFGHLQKLGISIGSTSNNSNMLKKAISYIDEQFAKTYNEMKKHCDTKCLSEDNLNASVIHYLYTRSFFKEIAIPAKTIEAFNYYKGQCEKYWLSKSYYEKGMIALALHRFGGTKTPQNIIASLKETAMHNEEMGTYWKYNSGYYWYQAPIETQSLLIEVFREIANDQEMIEEMKVWLLKQKQTQDWKTTKATVEAVYALLLQGNDLLADSDFPIITVGKEKVDPQNDSEIKTEAGTGYFKKAWAGDKITNDFGNISVLKKQNSVSWGAAYWQYFEQLDKIKNFQETPLKIDKKLFVERRNGDKLIIIPLEKERLKVGDKVKVRIEIKVDRDMEYVHLKDMRAACFEPTEAISGYRWSAGLGYYQAIKDASMNFFIDNLRKGVYVFEYQLIVAQKGEFSNGVITIQCMYAPEFTSHSEGVKVVVEE